ncbi:MAG: MFS transporter [Gammaproteobacteria bacterium]
MAQRRAVVVVYGAGLVQGLGLVTFPAASTIFTSPAFYGLSSTAYGGMFVPQVVLAIAASVSGAMLRGRLGIRRIYLLGLAANLLAMVLLVVSRFVMAQGQLAYGMLLAATGCMGIGFGFTVPALNTLVAKMFPRSADKAVLSLNALLGLGTALAPALVALFVGLGIWWGLPVVVAILVVGLLLVSIRQPLEAEEAVAGAQKKSAKVPLQFWLFATFALCSGVCETINGNWASLYMTKHFGASTGLASLALTVFWSLVTIGRVVFAALEKWLPERLVWQVSPFVVAVALAVCATAPASSPLIGILGFGLAGLGCSALLPLVISFGQQQLVAISASVAGGLITFYQIGYGLAAFGVGPLQSWSGADLGTIYGSTAVVALVMASLSLLIARKMKT